MSDPTLEPRVTLPESLIGEFVAGSIRTQQSVEQLSLEMREFKGEMRDFTQEMREETRRFNKQLGEIANKQGRIPEDLVAPSIGRILREITHSPCEETEYEAVRVRIHHRISGERREFDVLAICGEYVLIVETKITLTPEKVDGFVELIEDIRNYFPNYESRKMIGGLATLYADTSIATYASMHGILVLAVGDDLMDIQNGPVFRPREF